MSRSAVLHRAWRELPHDAAGASALASALDLPSEVGALLWQRGLRDEAGARAFLRPSLGDLHPPEAIPDLERAAARILEAAAAGARIAVYGDYDVDGVCATAILVEALAELGIPVRSYIPHRLDEGYGLNEAAVRRLRAEGIDLLVTVDGGANDRHEHAVAREIGLEVIVTDHHPLEGELPDTLLVHPGRTDHPSPSAVLCGAGVAYKLAWGLGRRAAGGGRVAPRFRAHLEEALALAALGTVADVVPLVGENRAIVAHGLRAISRTPRPGLVALLSTCGVTPAEVAAGDIAFRLAPHLNAAGRLGEVGLALELLRTRDEGRAEEIAASLAALNRRRKSIEQSMVDDCLSELATRELGDVPHDAPLLFAREGWHSGVAGIVAARLVERFERPVFIVAFSGELGRGSARSIPERPLTDLYGVLREHVRAVGGHALAGGITLERDRLDALRTALAACGGGAAAAPLPPRPYDLAIPGAAATLELARAIALLAPFGAGNPEPIFRIDGLRLAEPPRLVGRGEEHLQLRFRHEEGPLAGIWFRGAPHAGSFARASGPVSILAALEVDRFRGDARASARIVGLP